MATKYEEVTLASIDQGAFLEDGEKALLKVQKKIIAHAKEHGIAVGEVNLKVKISVDGDGFCKLLTDVTEKMPKKPGRVLAAFIEEGNDGTECLFSQAGGPITAKPQKTQQMQICDDEGPPIGHPDA